MSKESDQNRSSCLAESNEGVILRVHVQTRASRDEIVGTHGDALKIRITAAPVAGAANKHLLKLLSKKLKIPRGQLSIQTGTASRAKTIVIHGASVAEVLDRLA